LAKIELSEPLYRSLIGKRYPPFTVQISAARVRKYAELIGDTSRVHQDSQAARAAGYRDITAPPTFGFTLALLAGQSDLALADLGVTVNETLHGEHRFDYFSPLCAGDVLTGCQWIEDLKEKKGGTLLFLITGFELNNQLGELALRMVQTSIVPLNRRAHNELGT
jgi:acyl dehydratase